MYVPQINNQSFGNIKMLTKAPEILSSAGQKNIKLNRAILQKTTQLKNLNWDDWDYNNWSDGFSSGIDEAFDKNGYYNKEYEARKVVNDMTVANTLTAAALAQVPVGDELVLSAVELAMGIKILREIYNFDMKDTYIKSFLLTIKAGLTQKAASKLVTWIPFIGNVINAAVAGYTTKAFGDKLVDECERIQAEINRGKKIDDILKGL